MFNNRTRTLPNTWICKNVKVTNMIERLEVPKQPWELKVHPSGTMAFGFGFILDKYE